MPPADRNLLFGILALQNDFITRDQLVEAMHAWVLAKHRSLGDVLRERGALGQAQHELLDAIVNLQVAKHGGDLAKSLQALSSGAARAVLATVQDADLKASLACASAARTDEDPYATRAPATADTARAGGPRYRVLRPHARGGLGEVFVAEDQELHREVALKEIQPRHADDPYSRGRFILEAEITGRLEHPGIVPVYGLGCYADGRPFYAMRFIRGDNLEHAIERFHWDSASGGRKPPDSDPVTDTQNRGAHAPRSPSFNSLDFRRLLRRFLDVCNAVAYAHSRGVLHRDLKPGNVMLGEFGETLVVDWGLAKVVGRTQAPSPGVTVRGADATLRPSSGSCHVETVAGVAVGTPAFMSPEQAEGKLDQLGPATDVYSLGATLYAVLTGRPPIDSSACAVAEVLEKVRRGDIAPGGAGIPTALAAICRKAMALRPADRYPTALALAADIEHWLADEPVAAYRAPWTVRTRRWARKHRTLVTGAAAALIVTAIALAAGLSVVTGFNQRLEDANAQLSQANVQLQERQRIADKNFTLALDAVRAQVFDINRELQNRSGTRALRAKLQQSAMKRLDDLVEADKGRAVVVDHTAFWAYINLGDVYLEVDLRPTQAGELYERAAGIAQQLVADDPGNVEAQRVVWVSLIKLGDVSRHARRTDKAQDCFTRALKLSEELAQSNQSDLRAQRDLSVSLNKLGDLADELHRPQAALDHYQRGLEIRKQYAPTGPNAAQAPRDLAVSYTKLGEIALKMGQPDAALQYHSEAFKINDDRLKADRGDAQARRDLSISCERLGDVHLHRKQLDKAIESYSLGLKVRLDLANADPGDARAQQHLSINLAKLGNATLQRGELPKALEFSIQGLAIDEKRAHADPDDPQAQLDWSDSLERLGNVALSLGQRGKAVQCYLKERELRAERAKAFRNDAQAQRRLWVSCFRLGDVYFQAGEPAMAVQFFTQAHKVGAERAAANGSESETHRDLGVSLERMGLVHEALGRFEEAAGWFQKEIDLAGKRPDPQALRLNLKLARYKAAGCAAAPKIIDDLTRVAELPEPERVPALAVVMYFLARQQKKPAPAARAAELLAGMTKDGDMSYNAACTFALCVPLATDADKKEHYAKRAVEVLRQAIEAGYKDAAHMKKDKDLDAIREREDFKKLLV